MARVDILSTTDRPPGGRHAPTFSTVEAVHTGLIERSAGSKPRSSTSPTPKTSRDGPNISNRSLAQCSTMSAPS